MCIDSAAYLVCLFNNCIHLVSKSLFRPLFIGARKSAMLDELDNSLEPFLAYHPPLLSLFLSLTQCGKVLDIKSRQTARMTLFRTRAKEWAQKIKKSRNQAKIFDNSALLVIRICLSILVRNHRFLSTLQKYRIYFTLRRETTTIVISFSCLSWCPQTNCICNIVDNNEVV